MSFIWLHCHKNYVVVGQKVQFFNYFLVSVECICDIISFFLIFLYVYIVNIFVSRALISIYKALDIFFIV